MNQYIKVAAVCLLAIASLPSSAQEEKTFIRERVQTLAAPDMLGRGYVNNGCGKAANYIAEQFRSYGVQPLQDNNGSYFQDYTFPINTYPGKMSVTINDKELVPGHDYIINAASSGRSMSEPAKIKKVNLSGAKDSVSWERAKSKLKPGGVYYLQDADTPTKYAKLGIRKFATELPDGVYIVPKHGKLTWTANSNREQGTIIYVEDTVLPKKPKTVMVDIENKFIEEFSAKNVVGYVPGTAVPDSFIVFTGHYDHLGCMGTDAIFYGASDNASGTSLVLYLASYFAKHPQRYSVAFMLFSGEEVGLLGSEYYVDNPIFPLEQIRFLVNLDMTGDAKKGITVVNGVSHEPEFALLEELNGDSTYVKKINKRERTSNSDHYHFSKEGVPAVFIYGMGSIGHYHDVFDVADDVNLDSVDGLAQLLIKFAGEITDGE